MDQTLCYPIIVDAKNLVSVDVPVTDDRGAVDPCTASQHDAAEDAQPSATAVPLTAAHAQDWLAGVSPAARALILL